MRIIQVISGKILDNWTFWVTRRASLFLFSLCACPSLLWWAADVGLYSSARHWGLLPQLQRTSLPMLSLSDLRWPSSQESHSSHVLQDSGIWPAPYSNQYRPGCDSENVTCLSAIGWFFTIFCTWSGYTCLIWGVLWLAQIHLKVALIYRKIKNKPMN
ncbi:hypothetical protein Pelo_7702 [Pelomyxa schiedti]|nr:hypothetical protein Pelo_7702 [Pelomyxa schiedti]